MSYVGFVDHPNFGRVWYEAELRNTWVMDWPLEKNLARGPSIQARVPGYLVTVSGRSIESVERSLLANLDWHVVESEMPYRWTLARRMRYFWITCLPGRILHPLRTWRGWRAMTNSTNNPRIPREFLKKGIQL